MNNANWFKALDAIPGTWSQRVNQNTMRVFFRNYDPCTSSVSAVFDLEKIGARTGGCVEFSSTGHAYIDVLEPKSAIQDREK